MTTLILHSRNPYTQKYILHQNRDLQALCAAWVPRKQQSSTTYTIAARLHTVSAVFIRIHALYVSILYHRCLIVQSRFVFVSVLTFRLLAHNIMT